MVGGSQACVLVRRLLHHVWPGVSTHTWYHAVTSLDLRDNELRGSDLGALVDALATSGTAVLYLSVVTTALCNWLQFLGQARIGASYARVGFGRRAGNPNSTNPGRGGRLGGHPTQRFWVGAYPLAGWLHRCRC